MKHLARLADERWASKPSFLDSPKTQNPLPTTKSNDAAAGPAADPATATVKERSNVTQESVPNKGNPGDQFQPDSWTPTSRR